MYGCKSPVDHHSAMTSRASNMLIRTGGICLVLLQFGLSYNVPSGSEGPWPRGYRPVDYMVDITNNLAINVLYEHNFLNDNNIAFSPYGLTGILIALYEGVDGMSSAQIRGAMRLPPNRDIIRIGFRDIHRRLRSYFIPKEGFLAGLAFNNENVTFRPEYKKILQFYGYDFEMPKTPEGNDSLATVPSQSTETINTVMPTTPGVTTTIKGETETVSVTMETFTPRMTSSLSSQSAESSTESTIVSAMADALTTTSMPTEVATSTAPTTMIATSPSTAATTAATTATTSATTSAATTAASTSVTTSVTTEASTAATTAATTSVTTESSTASTTAATSVASTDASTAASTVATDSTTPSSTINTTPSSESSSEPPPVSAMLTQDSTPATQTTEASTAAEESTPTRVTRTTNSQTTRAQTTNFESTATSNSGDTSQMMDDTTITIAMSESSTNTDDETTPMPSTESSTSENDASTMMNNDATNEISSDTTLAPEESRKRRSILAYDYIMPFDHDQFGFVRPTFLRNPNYESRGLHHQRSFLANGYNRVQITYMTYDSVLEFAYIPYLRSLALKLPLDTTEYYLLILLPEYEFGVNQLVKDLQSDRAPTLRDINYTLKNTYVHAWVPTFMLKGFIVLTSDLQKLGICDPFEPRQDDFNPMTKEKNIYVRNIEQAITVTIRKYMEPSVKKRYAQNQPPVEFAATHPFLYFVMDSGIHVSLMAGKIVNPLNSRIL